MNTDTSMKSARRQVLEKLPPDLRATVIEELKNTLNDDDPTWSTLLLMLHGIESGFKQTQVEASKISESVQKVIESNESVSSAKDEILNAAGIIKEALTEKGFTKTFENAVNANALSIQDKVSSQISGKLSKYLRLNVPALIGIGIYIGYLIFHHTH